MSDIEGQGADPFGETTDPEVYVGRPAAEEAIAAAVGAVTGRRIPAIVGPPGIGKTLVMLRAGRALAERLGWESVHLRYSALAPDDLCRWVLGLLGVRDVVAPRETLLARAKAEVARGRGLLVLVDEAGGLAREACELLAEMAWQTGGGLGLVLAATDDARASRAMVALGPDLEPIRYTQPLSAEETGAYVAGRLSQTGAPVAVQRRFDREAVGWIHRLSGGIPRRIHELAAQLIQALPEDVTPGWWQECGLAMGSGEDDLDIDGQAASAGRPPSLALLDALDLWVAEDEQLDDLEIETD